MIRQWIFTLALVTAAPWLTSCRHDTPPPAEKTASEEHGHDHEAESHAHEDDAPTERGAPEVALTPSHIDIPPVVRSNLGLTFAKVERRQVAQTIRVPGQFELLPGARREYRTMLAGRVELLVQQYEQVAIGTALYRLDSPPWRELQEKLSDAEGALRQAQVRVASTGPLMAAHRKHEESLRESVALWAARVSQLDNSRGSGVVTADEYTLAQTSLAANRAQLAEVLEKEAELEAQRGEAEAQLDAAQARLKLLIATAAMLLGVDEHILTGPCTPELHAQVAAAPHDIASDSATPLWREIDAVVVRATAPGVVETLALTNGAWAADTSLVLTTVQPEQIRFRARGLQSDLGRLRAGLAARIVPPKGGSLDLQDTMTGELTLGLGADPNERTLELLVTPRELSGWARPGVSAHLEVTVAGGDAELAIPLSAVIQDGLDRVFFRRDPQNPDRAIRLRADLGADDGRWVVVRSGVHEGDEVVLDGVYQLMLATSGKNQQAGHFHADGTFHDKEH